MDFSAVSPFLGSSLFKSIAFSDMNKFLVLLLTLLSFPAMMWAQKDEFNPIHTGVNSLNIAPDARGGGMGDIGAATEPDNNSQYWNPAKYPFAISRAGVSVSSTPWLRKLVSDIDLAYLAGYYLIGEYQAVIASWRHVSLCDFPLGHCSAGLGGDSV